MAKVNIIGAGRVGCTFLRLLGNRVQDFASARRASAEAAVRETGHGRASALEALRPADIWLLTVPDTQIVGVAASLARRRLPPAIAVHCSGFYAGEIMAPLGEHGWQLASAHPNLSFADSRLAAAAFPGTPCAIEGDEGALDVVEALFNDMGGVPFRIAAANKALYHAAAVFSNNFATALQAAAVELWQAADVPASVYCEINEALLKATLRNVSEYGAVAAMTGPAARGDSVVVKLQRAAVASFDPKLGTLYAEMSDLIARQIKSSE